MSELEVILLTGLAVARTASQDDYPKLSISQLPPVVQPAFFESIELRCRAEKARSRSRWIAADVVPVFWIYMCEWLVMAAALIVSSQCFCSNGSHECWHEMSHFVVLSSLFQLIVLFFLAHSFTVWLHSHHFHWVPFDCRRPEQPPVHSLLQQHIDNSLTIWLIK